MTFPSKQVELFLDVRSQWRVAIRRINFKEAGGLRAIAAIYFKQIMTAESLSRPFSRNTYASVPSAESSDRQYQVYAIVNKRWKLNYSISCGLLLSGATKSILCLHQILSSASTWLILRVFCSSFSLTLIGIEWTNHIYYVNVCSVYADDFVKFFEKDNSTARLINTGFTSNKWTKTTVKVIHTALTHN